MLEKKQFWKMLHDALLKFLRCEIAASCTVMFFCNLGEENVRVMGKNLEKENICGSCF